MGAVRCDLRYLDYRLLLPLERSELQLIRRMGHRTSSRILHLRHGYERSHT